MPEWSNGAVSKTVVRMRGPGVRIPLSPQPNLLTRPAGGLVFYYAVLIQIFPVQQRTDDSSLYLLFF